MFLSSSLAVFLILISILIILSDAPNYFLGLIIPAIFLINPIYSLFFIISLTISYLIKLIISYREYVKILKEIVISISLSIGFLSIYVLSLMIFYNKDIFSIISDFTQIFELTPLYHPELPININENAIMEYISFNSISMVPNNYDLIAIYYTIFLVLPLIGILLNIIEQENKIDFTIFITISSLFMVFIAFIFPFFNIFNIFYVFRNRIIEAFLPCLIILGGILLNWILKISEKFWEKIKTINFKFAEWYQKDNLFNKLLTLPSFIVILIFSSSILTYTYANENFMYNYRYDPSIIDCIFYIENNVEQNSILGVVKFNEAHTPNNLLYNYELYFLPSNYNLSLNEFINFTQSFGIKLFIINLSYYNGLFREQFNNSFNFSKTAGGANNWEFQLYKII
jgi:hypothetical protein